VSPRNEVDRRIVVSPIATATSKLHERNVEMEEGEAHAVGTGRQEQSRDGAEIASVESYPRWRPIRISPQTDGVKSQPHHRDRAVLPGQPVRR
jgi:hypothetical protein